ncbi:MAG: bifunctional hydroxymethylpyrimidine kinase/phosphomethylpyrimidine kinase [Blastocatellia bacterium]
MQTVLTIAGFDPSGGAGVLADIKAFAAHGCFGVAAITSLTAQNTTAVLGAYHQPPDIVRAQLEPLISDFQIAAVKTGMLPTREIIALTAEFIARQRLRHVVIDPVIRSTSGYDLIDDIAAAALIQDLFPLADVITPNLAEAERLTGLRVRTLDEMKTAARRIHALSGGKIAGGPARAVLVKGGHLEGHATAIDVLYDNDEFALYEAARISTRNTHGTGCTLSAAIAALLARGHDLRAAIGQAKQYVTAAIAQAPGLGHGAGPLNHFPEVQQ